VLVQHASWLCMCKWWIDFVLTVVVNVKQGSCRCIIGGEGRKDDLDQGPRPRTTGDPCQAQG
jgi:hypothetical protein